MKFDRSSIGKIQKDFKKEIRDAQRDTLGDALKIAKDQSVGLYTTSTLRKMGHPYRIGGPGISPNDFINKQRKRGYSRNDMDATPFRFCWRRTKSANGTPAIFNISRLAGWLEKGTRKMQGRPLLAKTVLQKVAPILLQRIRDNISRK